MWHERTFWPSRFRVSYFLVAFGCPSSMHKNHSFFFQNRNPLARMRFRFHLLSCLSVFRFLDTISPYWHISSPFWIDTIIMTSRFELSIDLSIWPLDWNSETACPIYSKMYTLFSSPLQSGIASVCERSRFATRVLALAQGGLPWQVSSNGQVGFYAHDSCYRPLVVLHP